MPGKDIEIPRRNGKILKAVHYTLESYAEESQKPPFVIICHGFTGDKYEWGRFPRTSERLLEEGIESVFFDFSGSGKNEREPITLSKQARDLEDVFAWAEEQGYKNIATIGLSFGGLTSLVAELPRRKSAVFWAPAFNMKGAIGTPRLIFARILFAFRKKPIKVKSLNNEDLLLDWSFFKEILELDVVPYLKNFTIPTLIVQGTKDTAVNPKEIEEFFKLMPQDEHHRLVMVEGATHDFAGEQLETFINHTIDWLKRYMK